ncbi:hypothetical protein [Ramlibacter sp.]|uniref:hypothetical protein n=1 Tax=Ramlibacter sp. TaxID=1917967 RepID=UPI003D13E6B6
MKKLMLSLMTVGALAAGGSAMAQTTDLDRNNPYCASGWSGHPLCTHVYVDPNGNTSAPYYPAENAANAGVYAGLPYILGSQIFNGAQYPYTGNQVYRQRNDRDGDGIPNARDKDRDGDGVRNNRDRHPDDPRWR